eukprot:6933006-Alexandrium_andersonii.AAC.1
MRPPDAPAYTHEHGPLLAEEVAVVLGERIEEISHRTGVGRREDRMEQEGHGVFPFAAGDGEARLQWLSQVRAGRVRPRPTQEAVVSALTWMAQEMGQQRPGGRTVRSQLADHGIPADTLQP